MERNCPECGFLISDRSDSRVRELELQVEALKQSLKNRDREADSSYASMVSRLARWKQAPTLEDAAKYVAILELQVGDLQKKLAQIHSAVCLNCKGSGEFGLADGEVPCWVCGGSGDPTKPGVFSEKRKCEHRRLADEIYDGERHCLDCCENVPCVCKLSKYPPAIHEPGCPTGQLNLPHPD